MIFDDLNQPRSRDNAPPKRVRRRRRSGASSSRDFNTSRSEGTFEKASKLHKATNSLEDRGHRAWLVVLGVLILVTMGFALYLHFEQQAPQLLSGEAPTAQLMPFVDPILAPLQTGGAGYGAETLESLATQFRQEREKASKADAEIYLAASTIADFLREALVDRERHLERLEALNGPGAPAANPTQLKHLELAVDVSWRRNSTAHRDSIEQIWVRLQQLEQGRFRTEASRVPAALPVPQAPSQE